MKQFDSLAQVYQYATCEYSSRRANMMSDGKGGYTYNEFRNVCNHVSDLLSSYGIGSGDKVALLSGSTPNWSLAFFATVAFGRVSVPILPDFSKMKYQTSCPTRKAKRFSSRIDFWVRSASSAASRFTLS